MNMALGKSLTRLAGAITFCFITFCLSGCSMGGVELSGSAVVPQPISGVTLKGVAHGGQSPISGVTLQLYVAGMPAQPTTGSPVGGFGQGATALIAPGSMTVGSTNNYWPNGAGAGATCIYILGNTNKCTALPQTDSNGFFTITSDWTCPTTTTNPQVYLVGTGGNPGLTGVVNNSYIAEMVGLGACSSLLSSTYIFMDEVTTVAAVFALNNFISAPDGTHAASAYAAQGGSYTGTGINGANGVSIGASSGPVGGYGPDQVQTQQVGLTNAFRMVPNIANNSTGVAVPVNSWATNYPNKINAIANILASCINSSGASSPASAACPALMADATPSGGATPQDTIQVAWEMARNPMLNTATLLALGAPSAPFQPTMTALSDWTIVVSFAPVYNSSNIAPGALLINHPLAQAIDENGHLWTYNESQSSNTGATLPFISEMDANGAPISGPYTTYNLVGGQGNATCTGALTAVPLGITSDGIVIDEQGTLWGGNLGQTGYLCPNGGTGGTYRSLFRITTDAAATNSTTMLNGYWEASGPGSVVVDSKDDIFWNTNNGSFQAITASGTYLISATSGGQVPVGSTADMKGNIWFNSQAGCSTAPIESILSQLPAGAVAAGSSSNPSPTTEFYTSGGGTCKISPTATEIVEPITASVTLLELLAADANNGIWGTQPLTGTTGAITYFAPQSNAWTTATATAPATGVAGTTVMPTTGAQTLTTNGYLNAPWGLAVDGANHAWVGSNSVATATSNYLATDVLAEYSVTLTTDGNNNISSINLLNTNSAVTPAAEGIVFISASTAPFPHGIQGVSVDPSGNLWLLNAYTALPVTYASVVVGAGTPVVTPIALQTEYNLIGQTPQ